MSPAWPVPASDSASDVVADAPARLPDDVLAAFLIANPDWLAARPALYRCLTPPARVHGDGLADHMAAMLRQERLHAQAMTRQIQAVLSAGRANAVAQARVQEAVLALIALPDPGEIVDDLPHLLDADAAVLVGADDQDDRSRRVIAQLGSQDVVCREAPDDAELIYAEAAALVRHDVLVRVPGAGVLAIASRHPIGVEPTTGPLQFLGRALGVALEHHRIEPIRPIG